MNKKKWLIMISFSVLFGVIYAPLLVYLGIARFLMFKLPTQIIGLLEMAPYPLILLILSYLLSKKKTWWNVGGVFLVGLILASIATFLFGVISMAISFS
jgi:hypothetical protein